ncbi:MAG: thiol:disulfide interchange protein DsbA/DsbL [Porticoccaceae bacterium]
MAPSLKTLTLRALATTALVLAATLAQATDYVAGKHYTVLDEPIRTGDASKIEVTEVFWYGCGHCYAFEPLLEKWSKTLPPDVVLLRSPAIWHPTMELHARAYYTAKALNVLDPLHRALFDAMNVDHNKLATEDDIKKIFTAHGVDGDTFSKTFNSFGVGSAVGQADARQRGYKISGTPEMVVEGKYRVSASQAGSHEAMLAVIDHLIAVERAARAKRHASDSAAPAK